jgi:hypothetical protein
MTMYSHLRFLFGLAVLLFAFSGVQAGQYCNPAVVTYIVRDQSGAVLSEADLKTVVEALPKDIGDAGLYPSDVSFKEDNEHYYWPEDADASKGKKIPALGFANAGKCAMYLSEVTLTYQGRRMHLIFNINIERGQDARRLVVDALPFQEGTFRLDMTGWSGDRATLIHADRWKKVKADPKANWRNSPILNKKSG